MQAHKDQDYWPPATKLVKVASVVDAQWWADNNAAVQARWSAWVAKQ